MSTLPLYAIPFLLAFVLSWILGRAVRGSAGRIGFLDYPDPSGGRKDQERPVPLGGGLALFAAFTGTVVVGCVALLVVPRDLSPDSPLGGLTSRISITAAVAVKLGAVLAGAAIALFTGLLDDRLKRANSLPFWAKLAGQTLAALPPTLAGIRLSFLPDGALEVIGTLLWIVLVTNAFNFLDNMDGLSAGVAAIATALFAWVALTQGQLLLAGLLVALLGSLAGFLIWNRFPAQLYLGDAGSHVVGNLLGTLTVLESYVTRESRTGLPILFPVLVLAVPLIDAGIAVATRIRERRPIHVADQGHLSHRLVARGLTKLQAVAVLYLVTLCLGLSAALLPEVSPLGTALILAQAVAIAALLLSFLAVLPGRRDGS